MQQADTLGPFLFSLVLQRVVNTIKSDDGCVSLDLHAWYLDDGALAGKSSSVLNAFNILQSLGPSFGDLSQFPVSVPSFNVPNMEILGSPIGDAVSCSQFVAKKHKAALALLSAIERIGTIDPQVALILLRSCASFCKLVNITRATTPSVISSALESYDAIICHTLAECTGVDATDVAWDQAQLSIRRGGFGFRSLVHHYPAAYIASLCTATDISPLHRHLADAILQFNHIPQSAALSIPNLSAHMPSQKKLSDLMEEVQFSSLLEMSSLADRARLFSITSAHAAAAWISVTPSISQGLHLLLNEFQVAVQWWLGINPSPTSSQDGSLLICPFCPSSTLDTLGHHCVTC